VKAAHRLFGMLPETAASTLLARWQEFEARETAEARFAYACDRLMPLLHNLQGGGAAWREHHITSDMVLALNAPIGDLLPGVWDEVRAAVEAYAAQGAFEHPAPASVQQAHRADAAS
jgi:putative hydrolase of HD superfamily